MQPTSIPARKLTYDDLLAMPDDGLRHELIDGVHYVTASPVARHQIIAGNLYFLIRLHLTRAEQGRILFAPLDIVFSMFDVVEPDLLFVSNERRQVLTERNVQGSPDLVVEILSPSTARRDEGVKLELYGRQQVREYWVVDPDSNTIRVYRRRDADLTLVDELHEPDAALSSPLLPGLALPLRKIFESDAP